MTNETTTAPAAEAVMDAGTVTPQYAAHRIGRVSGEMDASLAYGNDRLALNHIALWAADLHLYGGTLSDAVDTLTARAEAAEAERDRLALEVAALRGALAELDEACHSDADPAIYADRIMRAWAGAERALSAPPTPTPPAAVPVTGGEWTREHPPLDTGHVGLYWAIHRDAPTAPMRVWARSLKDFLDLYDPHDNTLGFDTSEFILWGPEILPDRPPIGWREALAALDQGQEPTP